METSERGLQLIKNYEGFRSNAYQDSVGVWTIGYGTTNSDGINIQPGMTMSEAEADKYLRARLADKYEVAVNNLNCDLNQNQFDALVSFCYNLGPNIFNNNPDLKEAIVSGNYEVAAQKMLQYDHAGGQRLRGLTRRRTEESQLFLDGNVQELAATKDDPTLQASVKNINEKGYGIDADVWSNQSTFKTEYKDELIRKLGGMDKLKEAGVITDSEKWTSGNVSKGDINSLLTKASYMLDKKAENDKAPEIFIDTNDAQTAEQSQASEQQTTEQPQTSEQQTTEQPQTSEQQTTEQPQTSEQQTTGQPQASEQSRPGFLNTIVKSVKNFVNKFTDQDKSQNSDVNISIDNANSDINISQSSGNVEINISNDSDDSHKQNSNIEINISNDSNDSHEQDNNIEINISNDSSDSHQQDSNVEINVSNDDKQSEQHSNNVEININNNGRNSQSTDDGKSTSDNGDKTQDTDSGRSTVHHTNSGAIFGGGGRTFGNASSSVTSIKDAKESSSTTTLDGYFEKIDKKATTEKANSTDTKPKEKSTSTEKPKSSTERSK